MGDSERYTIDAAHIVSEIIDREAIIINLANGYYYSLDAAAAEIWGWIQAGWSAAQIISALQRRYDCSGTDPETAVRALIASFTEDDLIAPCPASDGPLALEPLPADKVPHPKVPFSAPTFQRFADMQEFLLVDPIHEVGDTGWPNTKPGG